MINLKAQEQPGEGRPKSPPGRLSLVAADRNTRKFFAIIGFEDQASQPAATSAPAQLRLLR